MTKEDAILVLDSLSTWLGCETPITEEIVEAIKTISKTSLPSNLDEAAEEYAYNNWEDNDYHTGAREGLPFDAIGHTEKCFKAGAEWMAGQGYTRECTVDRTPLNGPAGICMNLHDSTGFKIGDKVIVQIRKKD